MSNSNDKHALDAMDAAERIKIQQIPDREKPRYLGIIEGYLDGEYEPVRVFIPGRHQVVSSQEILIELANMADLELNDVVNAMTYLGYRVTRYDGKIGWVLAPVRSNC